MNWIKGFWRGVIEEVFLKSSYGERLVIDTLFRWLLGVSIYIGFYFLMYDFDARGVETDKWFHEVFGWKLSSEPSAATVAWHRLLAGILSGVTISVMTIDYGTHLYCRVKQRIANTKSRLAKPKEAEKPDNDTAL